LTVVKDLGLSTCLSMRAFLRAIKFVGEYNLQACLLNADKIIGILRKLEEVTRSAVEKAAQTQKVSLITNMLVSILLMLIMWRYIVLIFSLGC
jgi:hypothetical protein